MKKVLVLEDEASIRSFIVINLQRAGYEVVEAECGEEALQKLQENPDTKLCLLDIMLPDIDGFEVCRRIRMSNAQVGIIMLTARTQEMDKVTGLMTGADDYVTKPFSPAELTARVDALLRRMGENTPATHTGELYQPPFLLNLTNRTLEKNGERIKLTQIEYAIVKLFMENSGKALAREETRFVVPSILLALGAIGGRAAENALSAYAPPLPESPEQEKHCAEIQAAYKKAVGRLAPQPAAAIRSLSEPAPLLLVPPSGFADVLIDELRTHGAHGEAALGGVRVVERDLGALYRCRCLLEALIPCGEARQEPAAIAFGVQKMRTCSLFFCLLALSHCLAAVMRGAGRAVIPMISMLSFWCVVRVAIITVATPIYQSIAVVNWVYPITWALSSIFLLIYYYKADWLTAPGHRSGEPVKH